MFVSPSRRPCSKQCCQARLHPNLSRLCPGHVKIFSNSTTSKVSGAGARNGVRRLFTAENLPTTKGELKHTRLIRDVCSTSEPKSGSEALGISFCGFLDKEVLLKNIEHALCEYDKYFRNALGIPTRELEYSDTKSNQYINDDTND